MSKIKVAELKAGMRFDQPVYIEGENILVPAEIPIKQKDIDRLLRWDIVDVYTDGNLIGKASSIESAGGKEASAWFPFRNESFYKVYSSSIDKMEVIFQDINEGTSISHEPIDAVVNDLLELLRENKNETIQLIFMGDWAKKSMGVSAVNCLIIATVIGSAMKFVSHRQLQLATGALLHDIGMLKVPREILKKQDRLAPEELNQIRMHPVHSYRIISKELKYPEEIALIALQHQERWDGTGYPRRLKGDVIDLGARIVTVADAYQAMISERTYRDSIISYSAMKNILSDNGKHFDPAVLKAFIESMGVFPIGSLVQLNNSGIGRVAENHVEAPLRPKLEILLDEYGTKMEEQEIIDLRTKKNLFIVKALDPKLIGEAGGDRD